MMNMKIFTVDHGNSNSSILRWEANSYSRVLEISDEDIPVVVSNVRNQTMPESYIDIENFSNLFSLMPFEVDYNSTLGIDRLICALGAYSPTNINEIILIIDAGTFTTVDLIKNNIFCGGMILPGDKLLQSNYSYGSKLYEAEIETTANNYPFKTTEENLSKSIPYVLKASYQKIITDENITSIFITGGNSENHLKILRSLNLKSMRVTHDKVLLHKGLHKFYQQNIYNKDYQ